MSLTQSDNVTISATDTALAARDQVSPEWVATRHLIVVFKQSVKADAAIIRSAKRSGRDLQRADASGAPAAQAGLAALRLL